MATDLLEADLGKLNGSTSADGNPLRRKNSNQEATRMDNSAPQNKHVVSQGSITQSRTPTNRQVRAGGQGCSVQERNFKVFLQGSYGNTPIFMLRAMLMSSSAMTVHLPDINNVPLRADHIHATYSDGTFAYKDFKEHVVEPYAPNSKFG